MGIRVGSLLLVIISAGSAAGASSQLRGTALPHLPTTPTTTPDRQPPPHPHHLQTPTTLAACPFAALPLRLRYAHTTDYRFSTTRIPCYPTVLPAWFVHVPYRAWLPACCLPGCINRYTFYRVPHYRTLLFRYAAFSAVHAACVHPLPFWDFTFFAGRHGRWFCAA